MTQGAFFLRIGVIGVIGGYRSDRSESELIGGLRHPVGTHGLCVRCIKGYCVRCVKGYCVKLVRQRTLRPSVPTGRRPRYQRLLRQAGSTTDAQTERPYRVTSTLLELSLGDRLRRIVYLCREDPRLCRWVRSSDMLRAFCLFTSHAQSHESNSRHSP